MVAQHDAQFPSREADQEKPAVVRYSTASLKLNPDSLRIPARQNSTSPGGRVMVFVTVILTTSEWQRIAATALALWPTVEIDRQVSRNEVCRRFALCGIQQLLGAPAAQRERAMEEVERPLQPPGDNHMMPQLPGSKWTSAVMGERVDR